MGISEVYWEPCQILRMKLTLTIVGKHTMLDVWQGSKSKAITQLLNYEFFNFNNAYDYFNEPTFF